MDRRQTMPPCAITPFTQNIFLGQSRAFNPKFLRRKIRFLLLAFMAQGGEPSFPDKVLSAEESLFVVDLDPH